MIIDNLDQLEFKTPMMQQWLQIRKKYPGCLLLFRLGDFYELFLGDAKVSAEILGIALTTRNRGRDGRVPMCGIPYHALDTYLGKLIKEGYKVAICEQVEDASETSGMVDREVVRVVTPGTVLDEKNLSQKENNYILGIEIAGQEVGLAYADLSTGEIYIHEITATDLEKDLVAEVLRIHPSEVISSHRNYNNAQVLRALRAVPEANIYPYDNWEQQTRSYAKNLRNHFGVVTFEGFGLDKVENEVGLKAAAALLGYLKETQHSALPHIKKLTPFWTGNYMQLGATTIANLELFTTLRGQRGATLIDVLDYTHTAAGGRKLRKWLLKPLQDVEKIKQRLTAVGLLKSNPKQRGEVQEILSQILDIERLLSRISVGTANPRDLEGLKVSFLNVKRLSNYLSQNLEPLAYLLSESVVEGTEPLIDLLESWVREEPPATLADGGYIGDGVNVELDELRDVLEGGREWLEKFEKREKSQTGISSLKVDQNKVFGFYIEVSKANLDKVPDTYIRKQTLTNSERFIVPELKEREEVVLQAEERIKKLERELFEKLLGKILEHVDAAQEAANCSARIDVFASLAEVAEKNRYARPEVVVGGSLEIKDGRHPVIEQMQSDRPFVPNDTSLEKEGAQVLLITGPNMAGKSTYLRQTALITLLAQIGSFVPAKKAQIPIRDQIYTRVGASDNLSLGQSTFLVEMVETAKILNNCTDKSLVIFDEIGRGTGTFDGMSIAWAVIEYLVKNKDKSAFTLFATHYHELTVLADKFPEIKNLEMAVDKEKDEIIFLYKVVKGSAWQSYGVKVAKLAGLPSPVVERAEKVLQRIKKNQEKISLRGAHEDDRQISLLE
ncbi:MAG: DNA mismatch repair protein MutS [Patescibacteria group bacterium]|nr:DNA mismatch repair protein MutS [Patescibacteria group bacterium]